MADPVDPRYHRWGTVLASLMFVLTEVRCWMELWPALRTQLPADLWVLYLAVLQVGTLAIFYGCYKSQRLTWPVFVFVRICQD